MVKNHYAVVYVLTSGASVTRLLTWQKVWSTLQLVLYEDCLDWYVKCHFVLFHLCALVIQKSAKHVSRSAFTLCRWLTACSFSRLCCFWLLTVSMWEERVSAILRRCTWDTKACISPLPACRNGYSWHYKFGIIRITFFFCESSLLICFTKKRKIKEKNSSLFLTLTKIRHVSWAANQNFRNNFWWIMWHWRLE